MLRSFIFTFILFTTFVFATSSKDIQSYLKVHNDFRKRHGAKALVWSDTLATYAEKYVSHCQFEHSHGKYGENLAAGTGNYTIPEAIKGWTDESKDYNPKRPNYSHFTQVVWKGSQRLGCAVKTCNGIFPAKYGPAHYYVCEYDPPGNVIGHFASNVQA